MKRLLSCLIFGMLVCSSNARDPNVIIIFTDDQGYGDLGCYGSTSIKTPHLDQLAIEGMKLTDFHVPSPVCSPSRAGLLTGCYPKRVGMHRHVVFPFHRYGLHPDELTLADHLKANGYATACVGKWHLGHMPETLPTAQGFDSYFGIPYSNDMSHPDNKKKPRMNQDESWRRQDHFSKLWNTPLMKDEKIIELPVNQRTITRRYTDEAIRFITTNKDRPFFLYLPHSMPHIPLYVPDDVLDPDPKHAYRCVIEHIDAECGRLIQTVKDLGLEKETYIIFTSDNGPWLSYKHHGGSAGPLRSGKGTTFEGGQRVPCIIWGPGRVPAGSRSDALTSSIDLLPTLANLSGYPLKAKAPIDGLDLSGVFLEQKPSPRSEFLHYSSNGKLEGIRQGAWKLLVKEVRAKKVKGKAQPPRKQVMLYNLSKDLGEQVNVAETFPEKVATMQKRMIELDTEIEKNARPVFGQKR
ncbi:sulfatase [Verrucomicrobiaceae bacterium N1E253]|uniref:Sulfatase n=2 Tax=Oceaniferula marina TaxID=2748318 RepID=A0A851GH20_9BACT|nr:sulfatase [Oceaniferula marina]